MTICLYVGNTGGFGKNAMVLQGQGAKMTIPEACFGKDARQVWIAQPGTESLESSRLENIIFFRRFRAGCDGMLSCAIGMAERNGRIVDQQETDPAAQLQISEIMPIAPCDAG